MTQSHAYIVLADFLISNEKLTNSKRSTRNKKKTHKLILNRKS